MVSTSAIAPALIEKILAAPQQRLTFADYMDWLLYDPNYGYYATGQVGIGQKGDFFTASSLGSDFGELLAEQFREMWLNLAQPTSFNLVEMGAGTGILAQDILSYYQNNYPDFFESLQFIIIEKSFHLQSLQKKNLENFQGKVNWQEWENIAENSLVGCFFSNELVDAFPVHLVTVSEGKLKEIYVTYEQGCLRETIAEFSSLELESYFSLNQLDFTADIYPSGYRTEVNLMAYDWLKTVTQKLKQGYVLTIDYGYSAEKYYHPQRSQGTLQCYYQHRYHSDPYVNLGKQDITAHVNFTALENWGKIFGLDCLAFTQQGLFLMNLGLGDHLTELSSGKFKLPEIFQRRDALHQLIDPTGLGRFGVLLQAKGLDSEEARSLRGFAI
ncbi:MAG: class I SAM-dependent methyltransferase [Snowella sp.]|nr:class I SAM-dependent methyltransferase [Snowella sp.]